MLPVEISRRAGYMTESRDQQFFDALNKAGREEDDDTARTHQRPQALATKRRQQNPAIQPRFAADEPQGDPPAAETTSIRPSPKAGRWGQPRRRRVTLRHRRRG